MLNTKYLHHKPKIIIIDDIKKNSILKNGIGIECQKVQKQVKD